MLILVMKLCPKNVQKIKEEISNITLIFDNKLNKTIIKLNLILSYQNT